MPDNKTETKPDPKAAPKANLSPAGESSDPTVHALLAELQSARLNENDANARKVLDQLADLGYRAE
jgi:hypothetical protein